MNRKEKIELELKKIIEIGKKNGEISMDQVTEKFAQLEQDEMEEGRNGRKRRLQNHPVSDRRDAGSAD